MYIDWEALLLRLCVRHSKGGRCPPYNGEGESDGRREDGLYKVFRFREYESSTGTEPASVPHVSTGFGCYEVDREWLESHPFIYHEDTDDDEEDEDEGIFFILLSVSFMVCVYSSLFYLFLPSPNIYSIVPVFSFFFCL